MGLGARNGVRVALQEVTVGIHKMGGKSDSFHPFCEFVFFTVVLESYRT